MKKEVCWNITARCNQNCKYCHRFLNINDLTYDQNLKILNNLDKSGITSITWTGGEALLLNDIDELLQKSFEKGIKNKLISNGKLLTAKRIDKIYKYLDSITLSIDSINNGINKSLGRGENHYKEIKEILDYIKEKDYDIKIRINSVVCKNNINSFIELTKFLNNYNIHSWRIFKFMPLRERAIINKNSFEVSLNDYNKVTEYVKSNSNIKTIETRTNEDMEKKYILILANGDIVITNNGKDEHMGNGLRNSLEEFL